REVLDRSSAGIAALDDRPRVQIALLSTVSNSYRSLGELDKAAAAASLGAAKTAAFFGADSYEAVSARTLLGTVRLEQNRLPEAEEIARSTLKWLQEHPSHPQATEVEVAKANAELARIHFESGRLQDALPLARRSFTELTRLRGPAFPATMQAGDVLSTILSQNGEFAEAERIVRLNLAARESVYGKESLTAAYTMTTLANALQKQGKNDEAIALLRRILAIRRAALASDHPRLHLSMMNLGIALVGAGRQAEALPVLREGFEANKARLGEGHPRTLSAMGNLAYCLEDLGGPEQLQEAEKLFRRSVQLGREQLAVQGQTADSNDFCIRLNNLGALLLKAGKLEEADAVFAETIAKAADRLPSDHYYTAIFKSNRGRALSRLERFAEAEPLLLESHEVIQKQFGADHPRTHRSAWRIAEMYAARHMTDDADQWRRRFPQGYRDDR
ncbi:MAG TPA: tetratricopeptide repeat protein, partial [Phycisphaerales bacterium]|nr:tetratricopeptide repeat protein [Phycisphaerales bacterium]